MNVRETMKDNCLNKKETAELDKIHKEFDKTIFGKRIKSLNVAWIVIVVTLMCMACVCFGIALVNDILEENFDYTNAILSAVIFFTSGLLGGGIAILIRTHYEQMAMAFAYENKLLKK